MGSKVLLQIIPALGSGGAERGALDVAKKAVDLGWRSFIVSHGGGLEQEASDAGVELAHLPLHAKSPRTLWSNARQLRRLVQEIKPDIVHIRSRAPAWSAYWAGIPSNMVVTTYHGTYNAQNALKRRYNRIMLRAKRVICISKFIHTHVCAEHPGHEGKLRIIPRGIDVNKYRFQLLPEDPSDDRPIVLLPGRLTRWKGQMLLLEALKELPLEKRNFHVRIMGDAQGREAYEQSLHDFSRRYGLDTMVSFQPAQMDMPQAYGQAHIVVIPSLDPEAFGRVPVEAQAMGRVVVAAYHGGAMETMGTEGSCFPFDPKHAGALMHQLQAARDFLAHPAREEILAQASERVRHKFGLSQMLDHTFTVYDEVLSS